MTPNQTKKEGPVDFWITAKTIIDEYTADKICLDTKQLKRLFITFLSFRDEDIEEILSFRKPHNEIDNLDTEQPKTTQPAKNTPQEKQSK